MNSSLQKKDQNSLFALVLILSSVIILFWIKGGIFYSSFNLDEVILFFTSRGYFPNEAPTDPNIIKPISDMFRVNRNGGSLDPGVFTFILRYWGLVSLKTFWLRLLPQVFFILSLLFLFLAYKQIFKKSINAFFALVFPFTNPLILEYAFTIRPYSMEVCAISLLFFIIIKNHLTAPKGLGINLIYGFLLGFFLGSRYSFAIPLALYYFLEFFLGKKLSKKAFFAQTIPIGVCSILYYFVSYRYQVKLLPLLYAQEFFLKNLNSYRLLENIFNIKSWYLVTIYLYYFCFKRQQWTLETLAGKLLLLLGLEFIILVTLDLLGISPFFLLGRHSLGFQTLLCLITGFIILDGIEALQSKITITKEMNIFSAFLFMSLLTGITTSFDFKQGSDLVPIIRTLEKKSSPQEKVACDVIVCDMVKFLRYYNKYQLNWENMPTFEVLSFTNKEDFQDAEYYFTTFASKEVSKPDDIIARKDSLKLLYKGHYQRLYANPKLIAN